MHIIESNAIFTLANTFFLFINSQMVSPIMIIAQTILIVTNIRKRKFASKALSKPSGLYCVELLIHSFQIMVSKIGVVNNPSLRQKKVIMFFILIKKLI